MFLIEEKASEGVHRLKMAVCGGNVVAIHGRVDVLFLASPPVLVVLSNFEYSLFFKIFSFGIVLTLCNDEILEGGILVWLTVLTVGVSTVFIHYTYLIEGIKLKVLISFCTYRTCELEKLLSLDQVLLDHSAIFINLSKGHHSFSIAQFG